jgi:hypothetical protein
MRNDLRAEKGRSRNPDTREAIVVFDGPSRQRNKPGDHGTVPVRRTYASLDTKGPVEGSHRGEPHIINGPIIIIISCFLEMNVLRSI